MASSRCNWQPDFLDGYETTTLELLEDDEGRVVTTLIRPTTCPTTPRFVFIALHGWNDYFFQEPLAEFISELGGAFYGVDLRKYGRSHLDGQMWGYTTSLSTYDEDIHAVLDVVYSTHGTKVPIVLYGHSTGGLTASLWAHRHPGLLAGLVLNSPWLEFQGPTMLREAGSGLVGVAAKALPQTEIKIPDLGFYTRTLKQWSPDPRYRHTPTFPVRVGWLRAIMAGHEKVARGLDILCPILVLTAHRTVISDTWRDDMLSADTVLDVRQIWKRVPKLGHHTTLIKIKDAIHDVTLSADLPRSAAFSHLGQWLHAFAIPGSQPPASM